MLETQTRSAQVGARHLLVLWDVDHTLVDTRGVSRQAYGAAFSGLTGRPAPDVDMNGRTDRAIMSEMLGTPPSAEPSNAGAPAEPSNAKESAEPSNAGESAHADKVLDDFGARLAQALADLGPVLAARGRAMPGAHDVLRALSRPGPWTEAYGVVQTVLTGNIAATAATKLAAFGLDTHLDLSLGAYGDHHTVRARLVDAARAAYRSRYPDLGPPAVVIIGDSVHDVAAARGAGARCVAVASGRDRMADLVAAGADAVLPDLADVDAAVAAITGGDWWRRPGGRSR